MTTFRVREFVNFAAMILLTTASLARLAELAPESRIQVERFRPSLLIDTGDAAGFVEHDWSGRSAKLGGAPDSPLEGMTLDACVPIPRKAFGIGLNYRSHAEESGMEIPPTPLVFSKFPSCLTGPTGDVTIYGPTTDWEAEVVVVMGTRARGIKAEDAWEHVAGLTCGHGFP